MTEPSIDCEQCRARLAGDPAAADEAVVEHQRRCAGCAAYARRLATAESLIRRALRFDPDAGRGPARRRPRAVLGRRALGYVAAAAVVAAVVLWPRGAERIDPQALAAAVVAHWELEPQSWVLTDAAVAGEQLAEVTRGLADVDAAELGIVSYVRSCYVRGQWIPHLVVQGARGPVMVLLLPHEPLESITPITVEAAGLEGLLLPFGSGSIALLAEEAEPLEPLRERIVAAVDWTI